MKTHILAAVLLIGSSTCALAADPGMPMEESPVFSWAGGYVGATIGYGWADTNVTELDDYSFSPSGDTEFDFDSDGILGGVFVGYNWQSGNVVYGVEADFSATDIKNTVDNTMRPGSGESFSTNIDWFGTIRGRLGYAIDRWMPYVTGGLAFADMTSSYNDPPDNFAVASGTAWGWTVGAGAEFALLDNWTLRGEYLFVDLEDRQGSLVSAGEKFRYDFDNDIHVVRFGVAYKF